MERLKPLSTFCRLFLAGDCLAQLPAAPAAETLLSSVAAVPRRRAAPSPDGAVVISLVDPTHLHQGAPSTKRCGMDSSAENQRSGIFRESTGDKDQYKVMESAESDMEVKSEDSSSVEELTMPLKHGAEESAGDGDEESDSDAPSPGDSSDCEVARLRDFDEFPPIPRRNQKRRKLVPQRRGSLQRSQKDLELFAAEGDELEMDIDRGIDRQAALDYYSRGSADAADGRLPDSDGGELSVFPDKEPEEESTVPDDSALTRFLSEFIPASAPPSVTSTLTIVMHRVVAIEDSCKPFLASRKANITKRSAPVMNFFREWTSWMLNQRFSNAMFKKKLRESQSKYPPEFLRCDGSALPDLSNIDEVHRFRQEQANDINLSSSESAAPPRVFPKAAVQEKFHQFAQWQAVSFLALLGLYRCSSTCQNFVAYPLRCTSCEQKRPRQSRHSTVDGEAAEQDAASGTPTPPVMIDAAVPDGEVAFSGADSGGSRVVEAGQRTEFFSEGCKEPSSNGSGNGIRRWTPTRRLPTTQESRRSSEGMKLLNSCSAGAPSSRHKFGAARKRQSVKGSFVGGGGGEMGVVVVGGDEGSRIGFASSIDSPHSTSAAERIFGAKDALCKEMTCNKTCDPRQTVRHEDECEDAATYNHLNYDDDQDSCESESGGDDDRARTNIQSNSLSSGRGIHCNHHQHQFRLSNASDGGGRPPSLESLPGEVSLYQKKEEEILADAQNLQHPPSESMCEILRRFFVFAIGTDDKGVRSRLARRVCALGPPGKVPVQMLAELAKVTEDELQGGFPCFVDVCLGGVDVDVDFSK